MIEQLNKIGALKVIEILATSITLIGVLIYISGYQILAGFLEHQFGQPYFFGAVLPPVIFAYLGLVLLLSILISFPAIWMYVFGNLESIPDKAKDMVLVAFVVTSFVRFHPFNFLFSRYSAWFAVLFIVLLFSWALYLIIRCISSYKKRGLIYKIFSRIRIPYETKFLFIMLLPILYPGIIKYMFNSSPAVLSEIRLDLIYTSLLLPTAFSLALFMVSIKFVSNFPDNWNWLKILLAISYLISFTYGFSSLIGMSISESYIQKNKGIFPVVKIMTTEELFLPGTNQKAISFYLITKDSDFYYGFQPKKDKILVVPVSKVLSAEIMSK